MITTAIQHAPISSSHESRLPVQSDHSETTNFNLISDQTFRWMDKRQSFDGPARRSSATFSNGNWTSRKDYSYTRSNGQINGTSIGRTRQKSLSEAIRTIHARRGSVSANAQEIAEALKAPVSLKLVVCLTQMVSW